MSISRECVRWRGQTAAYLPSERELMRLLPVREQAIVHTLKALTGGELGSAFTHGEVSAPPFEILQNDRVPASGAARVETVFTDPEDIPFGKPKKTRPIYALVWSPKRHRVYKTKAKAQVKLKAWKMWHERQGWKVYKVGEGYWADRNGERVCCVLQEYDRDTKERLK